MSPISTTDKFAHIVNNVGMLLRARRGVLIFSSRWLSVIWIVSPFFYPTVLGISTLYPMVLNTNSPLTLTWWLALSHRFLGFYGERCPPHHGLHPSYYVGTSTSRLGLLHSFNLLGCFTCLPTSSVNSWCAISLQNLAIMHAYNLKLLMSI